jgi:hypothetical protein
VTATCTTRQRSCARLRRLDEAFLSALAKAISVLNNASALWIDASLDDRIRLQEVLFP